MKTLEKLEKYVRVPNTEFFGTYFYDGEDILLHDELEEFKDDSNKEVETKLYIKDYIENGVFHKRKEVEDLTTGAKEVTEIEYPVTEGDMLIFVMYEGFTKTKSPLLTVDEAIERLKMLRSDYYDTEGNEIKNT